MRFLNLRNSAVSQTLSANLISKVNRQYFVVKYLLFNASLTFLVMICYRLKYRQNEEVCAIVLLLVGRK